MPTSMKILRMVSEGQDGKPFPKSYFDPYPHEGAIARKLMWEGYIQHAGEHGKYLRLTPAGKLILESFEAEHDVDRLVQRVPALD